MAQVTVNRTRFLSMCRSYRAGAGHVHYGADILKDLIPKDGTARLAYYFNESEGWAMTCWEVDLVSPTYKSDEPIVGYARLLLPEDVLHKLKLGKAEVVEEPVG